VRIMNRMMYWLKIGILPMAKIKILVHSLTFKLTREEEAGIRKPWKESLIVKLWGKIVGYTYILRLGEEED
jgi:hypothetical protein